MSTGVVWGSAGALTPFVREGYKQITGGLDAFAPWFEDQFIGEYYMGWRFDELVCEKFKTRPIARNYKLIELEPIRIEGWLSSYGPTWQWPEQRSLTSDGVKASEAVLHAKNLWLTGKDVGAKDADDVNAAQLHLLAYLRNIGHLPTIEAYLL
jgi:hypothetical protein